MNFLRVFIGLLLILFASCKKTSIPDPDNSAKTASAEFLMRHQFLDSSSHLTDTAVAGAVLIYASSTERDNDLNRIDSAYSSTGVIVFSALTKSHYWYRASSGIFGSKDGDLSTPAGAVAHETVLF